MLHPKVQQPSDIETSSKLAGELKPGDRIAAGFLPSYDARDVAFVLPYGQGGRDWALIVHDGDDCAPDVAFLLADRQVPVEPAPDPTGLNFSREPEPAEAAPVAPGIEGGPIGRAAQNGDQ